MKKEIEQENTGQQSMIEDLSITRDRAADVKGGPLCHGVSVIAYARVDGHGL